MLLPEFGVRVWLHVPPTDMHKSFDGLSALVRQKLAEAPISGQLFMFINRRRTQLKVLYFEQGGLLPVEQAPGGGTVPLQRPGRGQTGIELD